MIDSKLLIALDSSLEKNDFTKMAVLPAEQNLAEYQPKQHALYNTLAGIPLLHKIISISRKLLGTSRKQFTPLNILAGNLTDYRTVLYPV